MATIGEIKAAYFATNRKQIPEEMAQGFALSSPSLDSFISAQTKFGRGNLVQAEVAAFTFLTGTAPSSDQLNALADFAQQQYNFYAANGYNAALAPFEALGAAIATDTATASRFQSKYGFLTDAQFVSTVYAETQGGALPSFTGNAATGAGDHFLSQLAFYTKIYVQNGTSLSDAALKARGAIAGQIVSLPFSDASSAARSDLDDAAFSFFKQAALGIDVYSKPDNADLFAVSQGDFDLSKMAAGVRLSVGAASGDVFFDNVSTGTPLSITGTSSPHKITYRLLENSMADSVIVTVKSAGPLAFDLNTPDIEAVNVQFVDTDAFSHKNTFKLTDTSIISLVLSGDTGAQIVGSIPSLKFLDARQLVSGGTFAAGPTLEWTTGDFNGDVVIFGSAAGNDQINASASSHSVTITLNGALGSIAWGSAVASNTLKGGVAGDSFIGGNGADTIVGGGGSDLVRAGKGVDLVDITGSKGATITQIFGDSGANSAAPGAQSISTAGLDVIKGFSAGNSLQIYTGVNATLLDLTFSASDLSAVDNKIQFARGNYSASDNTFSLAANGRDTLVTYDADSSAGKVSGESVVMVGFQPGAANVDFGIIKFG